jgi:putative transposase
VWQRRFWDHIIRNDHDFEIHLHYIHYNPVKHGFVFNPEDWPYSSYSEWVKRGLYPNSTTWDEPKFMQWGE